MQIKFKNAEELARKYGKTIPDLIAKQVIMRGTQKAVLYVHSQVPPYPAPPLGSTYRRTEVLGKQIATDVRPFGSTVIGLIGSGTDYSPWVISSEKVGQRGPQAGVHRGRWWTLQGVVQKASEAVIRIYESMFRDALNK